MSQIMSGHHKDFQETNVSLWDLIIRYTPGPIASPYFGTTMSVSLPAEL